MTTIENHFLAKCTTVVKNFTKIYNVESCLMKNVEICIVYSLLHSTHVAHHKRSLRVLRQMGPLFIPLPQNLFIPKNTRYTYHEGIFAGKIFLNPCYIITSSFSVLTSNEYNFKYKL